ncbi:MAG: formimidoylglutamase [Gammaproteobacteria bacterium]
MIWNTRYIPPDPNQWKGRPDLPPTSCFFQIMQMLNLLDNRSIEVALPTFALIGFRCDEGIRRNMGRVGAAEGPTALRQALAKLPIQKYNFHIYDAGSIVCADGDLETSQQALGEVIDILLSQGIKPIVMGGGHELAWGNYQGIAAAYPNKHLGIINFDAHFDLRPLLPNNKGNSGSSFLQIAQARKASRLRFDYNCIGIQHSANIHQLFETAKSYKTRILLADELHQGQLEKGVDFIDRVIDQNEIVYVSICLDVFSAAYAPGVSAIQPLGLLPWHVIPLVRQLAASGKVVSYDISELSPRYDFDQCTAKLAANLIYEIVHHHNEQPRPW